jgi:hypothetical protein
VSDGRLAIFDDFCARFEPMIELPAAERIVADTRRPVPEVLRAIEAAVTTWPSGLVA